MKIIKTTENQNIILKVQGRIDTTTAPEVRPVIQDIVLEDGQKVLMDCEDLEYISSAGLRELLIARKKFGQDGFELVNVSSDVEEILEVTGFSNMLTYSLKEEADPLAINSQDISFKELLHRKVAGDQSHIILSDGMGSYTWEEVEKATQIIASDLAAQGVKKGTHVGICGANSMNWVLTFFAVQKLGAIAVLMNYNLGIQEINALGRIADVTHLCFGEIPAILKAESPKAFLGQIIMGDSPITSVYNMTRGINFKDRFGEYDAIADSFREDYDSDAACVMIFTSGSTGLPKAALLSAYNIMGAALMCREIGHYSKEDVSCVVLPLFHIFGLIVALMGPFVTDAKLVFPSAFKAGHIMDLIAKEGCTLLHAVPTIMLGLANAPEFDPAKLQTLRASIMAGAPCTEAQFRFLQAKFPQVMFFSAYGMSEMAPITVTLYNDTVDHIVTTVGKPLPGFKVKIADNGEVMVQGSTQMCWYYKVDVDKQAIDAEGWLHTGDMGCFDEEGYLHLTGRIKDLIIRGGENISPGEVAEAISEDPDIADVKVLGVPDEMLGEAVCAAVVMKEGKTFDEAAMREALKAKLAKYKIPAAFVVYDSFPLLANGKIDAVNLKADVIRRVVEMVVGKK